MGRVQPEFLFLQFLLRTFDLLLGDRKLADYFFKSAGSVGKATIRQHTDETHPEHRQGNAGNRQSEQGGRERQLVGGPGRVGNELDRAHGGEMMRDDSEGQ
jgi:hypothetical protein